MITPLEQNLIALIDSAGTAKANLDAAEKAQRSQLEAVINALIPHGTRFNRLSRERPPYLFRVKTVRGNDRNTNEFVIAGPLIVDVNVAHPGLSTWACEATPISEKTGKPMNGASHGADGSGQTTVRIKGEFDPSWDNEAFENERLLAVVARAAAILPEPVPVPAGVQGDAARQYRLLQIGEVIEASDEFIDDDGVTWNPIVGWEVGMRFNHNLKSGRRSIASQGLKGVE